MTTQKKITLDGIDYVRADTIPAHAPADSPVRIVVLQRGWVDDRGVELFACERCCETCREVTG